MATPRYINTPVSDGGATQKSIEDSFNRFLAQRQQTQNFRQQLMAEERAAAQRALAEAKAEARRMDDRRYAEEREAERRLYEEEREAEGLRRAKEIRDEDREYRKTVADLARIEAAKAIYVRAGGSVVALMEEMGLEKLDVESLSGLEGGLDAAILKINELSFQAGKEAAAKQGIDQIKDRLAGMNVDSSAMQRGEGETDEEYKESLLRLEFSQARDNEKALIISKAELTQKYAALQVMSEEEYNKAFEEGGFAAVARRTKQITGQDLIKNAKKTDRITTFLGYKRSVELYRKKGFPVPTDDELKDIEKNIYDDKKYSDFVNTMIGARVRDEMEGVAGEKMKLRLELEDVISNSLTAKSNGVMGLHSMLLDKETRDALLARGVINEEMSKALEAVKGKTEKQKLGRAKTILEEALPRLNKGASDNLFKAAESIRNKQKDAIAEREPNRVASILDELKFEEVTGLQERMQTLDTRLDKFLDTPVPNDVLGNKYRSFTQFAQGMSGQAAPAQVPAGQSGTGQTPAAGGGGVNLPLTTGASQGGGGDDKLPMLEPGEVAQAPADQITDSGMTVEQSRALDELGVDWRNSRVPGVQLMLDQIEKLGSDVDLANKELGELKQQLFYGVKVTPGLALASGLADSQYDLSPAEKSDLRKRISSAESSISQKLSSIERLKRLTGTSTPETPAIPLTPIAKAEQSAQRGLLRKLEQTQTLARVKRQEGEQLRASSRAAAAAGKLETAERLRGEGDAILVEAKVIEQEALEIEKQLEGTSPVPQENKDLIESKRNFPSLPANPPELQVNRMENLPSGSAYSQFAEDMVDNAMYAPQAAFNTDPMNLQGLAPENLPAIYGETPELAPENLPAIYGETPENTAPTLLGTEMPPASSLRPPAYPPEPTPMPPASDLRPPAYNEAPPPVGEYQAPLTDGEKLQQRMDAEQQQQEELRAAYDAVIQEASRIEGRSLPMAPGVPAPSRPQVASQNIPQVPVMPPDYPVRRGADVMAPAVPKPVNPNVAPVGLPVRRGADIMAPAVPKPVNPNVAPTGLPVRRGADVMAPAVPKPMNPNVAGEEPLVTLPMPSGPPDDMALLEEAGVLLDGSRNIVDAIKDRLVEVSAYGTREDVAYIPVLQELLEKAINKTLAVDPDKVPTVEPMPEESIPPLPGLPR